MGSGLTAAGPAGGRPRYDERVPVRVVTFGPFLGLFGRMLRDTHEWTS